MNDGPITQDALDRVERHSYELRALENGYRIELRDARAAFHAERDLRYTERALAIKALTDERGLRYDERDRSGKEAMQAAFRAAEKALEVLAAAQKEYKASQNEWRATINDILAQQRGATRFMIAAVGILIALLGLASRFIK